MTCWVWPVVILFVGSGLFCIWRRAARERFSCGQNTSSSNDNSSLHGSAPSLFVLFYLLIFQVPGYCWEKSEALRKELFITHFRWTPQLLL